MVEVFSDIFARRDNRLTRMNPRAKLLVAAAAIAAVLLSCRPGLPLAVLTFCLVAMLALRIPARLVLARMAAPMGIVLVLVVVQSFSGGDTPLGSWWGFTATREGLGRGLLLACRVLAAVSVVLLLSLVTFAHQIFSALRSFGVPGEWVEVAMLMYRYVFTLLEAASEISSAQRLRLGYSDLRTSLRSGGSLGGEVLLRSLDQAARTHEAMTVRGYTGTVPLAPPPPLARGDLLLGLTAAGMLAAGFLLLG